MSNSGLIYAVIVGAWAAYLVPMWLRRQDELNDARPTERFSTAIRLLSGRAAMERRYTRTRDKVPASVEDDDDTSRPDESSDAHEDDTSYEAADVRSFADPVTEVAPEPQASGPSPHQERPSGNEGSSELDAIPASRPTLEPQPEVERRAASPARATDPRSKRARVLARRRRTTMLLFLWFTAASILAAVGGLSFLWAPALPALLLSAYIGYLRAQERRRFAVRLDRQRGEAAARRLRERRRTAVAAARSVEADAPPALSEDRQAVVEQTDHAEWVDQQRARRRGVSAGGSWDPVPVPLPTYVTAPVAPRNAERVDLDAPDTWSSARSTTAGPAEAPPAPRKPRRTPLFDQNAEADRPRAAGE